MKIVIDYEARNKELKRALIARDIADKVIHGETVVLLCLSQADADAILSLLGYGYCSAEMVEQYVKVIIREPGSEVQGLRAHFIVQDEINEGSFR